MPQIPSPLLLTVVICLCDFQHINVILNQYRCNSEDFEEVLETATRNKILREKVADLKEEIRKLKNQHKEEIRKLDNEKKDLNYTILKLQKENKMNYYSIR